MKFESLVPPYDMQHEGSNLSSLIQVTRFNEMHCIAPKGVNGEKISLTNTSYLIIYLINTRNFYYI